MELTDRQEAICAANETDFSDLRAILFNTTLERRPDESHTALCCSGWWAP